jgi:hypothetical protein
MQHAEWTKHIIATLLSCVHALQMYQQMSSADQPRRWQRDGLADHFPEGMIIRSFTPSKVEPWFDHKITP